MSTDAAPLTGKTPVRVISLGAGVQSTTMLLMSLNGDLPHADAAIFADTGCEPQAVYRHLEWLQAYCAERQFPLYIVSAGNLLADMLDAIDSDYAVGHIGQPPFYVRGPRDVGKREGRLWRKCTQEYKLDPLRHKTRELTGKGTAESWIGISLDEKQRMKPSGVKWLANRYPLIEQRMTRHDCLLWLAEHGYPQPPKSSCIICPFHNNAYWRHLRDTAPDDWKIAIGFDGTLRTGKLPGVAGDAFLHRSCLPLWEAPIEDEHTQVGQLPLWGRATGECEGVCFV